MSYRHSIGAMLLASVLGAAMDNAQAFDESKYPDWKGQWLRTDTGAPRYDPSKPSGRGQKAPLKPEFAAVLEESLAEQAKGARRARSRPQFRSSTPEAYGTSVRSPATARKSFTPREFSRTGGGARRATF